MEWFVAAISFWEGLDLSSWFEKIGVSDALEGNFKKNFDGKFKTDPNTGKSTISSQIDYMPIALIGLAAIFLLKR